MNSSQYKINNFIIEFTRLYRLNSNNINYDYWELKNELKWIFLIGYIYNKTHVLLKINLETLYVYAPRDLNPRGNLNNEFNGYDLFDDKGLIYNIHKERKELRINELLAIKKRRLEELNKEDITWKVKSLDYTVSKEIKRISKSSESCEF